MYMLSAFKAIAYIVLSVITVNIVHSGMTTAADFGHLDNYASVQNAQSNSECKPVCYGSPVANRSKVANIKKDERDPIPPSFNLSDHQFIEQSDNLLTDKQIWKLASWVPPDRLLQSSAYTTSH
jgi:hypothetical protein|tara:strand:- start:1491 stop:1862 length:372 start_codon:yes stop_codon:yes gene_type:complete